VAQGPDGIRPKRDGAEQCSLRAARRQLDANARNMFDHARPDLDQALTERRELADLILVEDTSSGMGLSNCCGNSRA